MTHEAWLAFAFLIAVATVSPGPNVLIVVTNTIRHGIAGAVLTIVGNLAALLLVAGLAALGVGTILKTMPTAYSLMKLAGAAYLVWMGYRMLRASLAPMPDIHVDTVGRSGAGVRIGIVGRAVLVSLSNPKSILFLSAVFPSFLDTGSAIAPQFGTMFLTIMVIVGTIHSCYALIAWRMRERLIGERSRRWMARLSGMTFMGLGVGVAADASR